MDTEPPGVEVHPYSKEAVVGLICKCKGTEPSVVKGKPHLQYLNGYLSKIEAKTIIFESSYTDRDYLEDYSEYYVRCFDKYSSRCARMHFFDTVFDEDGLRNGIIGDAEPLTKKNLQASYLGFIVIKPLPKTFIGRTCLRVYPEKDGRKYPVIREYETHLLGLSLRVKSLAFQEQDTIAAACATSALWSAFQGTGMLFHHEIPSPVSITKAATQIVPHLRRSLPSKGLNAVQMAAAVKAIGLEPEVAGAGGAQLLKATAYAYLRARLPILLIAEILDFTDPDNPLPYGNDGQHALHAVAVTGFKQTSGPAAPYPEIGTLLASERLTRLYVHDDQVGPFARVLFTDRTHKRENGRHLPLMETTWVSPNENGGPVLFAPTTLIIPLYHKIRVPFDTILRQVFLQDARFETKRAYDPSILPQRLTWDVYLTTSCEWKTTVSQDQRLANDERWAVLSEPFPRFLWRAVAFSGEDPVLEFLFDATDIEQGDFLFKTIRYQPDLADLLLG